MTSREVLLFDSFRRYPPEVSQRIAKAIHGVLPAHAGSPVLLELGVGTGAMALPLLARGVRIIGLDRDPEMLRRFREKVLGRREVEVLEADAHAIPLQSSSVDGVLVVRFWHLVPDWHGVLAEAVRVLRPGGVLLEGFERISSPLEEALFQAWEEAVGAHGIRVDRRQARKRYQEVGVALKALGFSTRVRLVARWREVREAEELVRLLWHRVFHFAKAVPEEVHRRAMVKVESLVSQLGGPRTPIPAEKRFYLRITRK